PPPAVVVGQRRRPASAYLLRSGQGGVVVGIRPVPDGDASFDPGAESGAERSGGSGQLGGEVAALARVRLQVIELDGGRIIVLDELVAASAQSGAGLLVLRAVLRVVPDQVALGRRLVSV